MHDQDVAVPEPAITLSRSVEALKSEAGGLARSIQLVL